MQLDGLYAYMESLGFLYRPTERDLRQGSKPVRFSRDGNGGEKKCWLMAHVELTTGGRENWHVTFSDYSEVENYVYRNYDKEKISEEDKRRYAENIQRQKEEAAKVAEKDFQEMQGKAKAIWDSAALEGYSEYLTRKQISGHGCRFYEGKIVIPLWNVPLWKALGSIAPLTGLQFISEDGAKRFLPGTRKTGSFYSMHKGASPTIYISEGFATGSSIFEAMQSTVYVAFDCGNLIHVAKVVRAAHPGIGIVICADNDRAREKGNVGVEKAKEAAAAVDGLVVIPDFSQAGFNICEKPSDWNDVHYMYGIAEVRKQIDEQIRTKSGQKNEIGTGIDKESQIPTEEISSKTSEEKAGTNPAGNGQAPLGGMGGGDEKTPEQKEIRCLGYDGADYYYITNDNKQISCVTSHSSTDLIKLMPVEYWIEKYGEYNKRSGKVSIDWTIAASKLMQECRSVGIFTPDKLRGVGCWKDKDKIAIHLGDRLIVDKNEFEIGKFNSNFIYELGIRREDIHLSPLDNNDCSILIDTCLALKWKRQDDCIFFLGWLALSRICGALDWRPHVWLTGPSGSGKSTLIEMVVKNIVGKWARQIVGNSSEAGIRQSVRRDSVCVYYDEAEANDKYAARRIQSILELVRQASSLSDAKIMKGTSNQKGMQFKVNCLFLLSSIRVALMQEADKNRFTVIELARNVGSDWPIIQKKLGNITEQYGERLFSRMICCYPSIMKNKEVFENVIAKIHNSRIGQHYGTLLAGYVALFSTGEITEEKATKIVSGLDLKEKEFIQIENDELECFEHLSGFKITAMDGKEQRIELSVYELLDRGFQECNEASYHYRNQLRRMGIKIDVNGKHFYVANRSSELTKIFHGTKWDGYMWSKALTRIFDATQDKTRFSGSNQAHCVKIPLDSIKSEK